MLAGAFSSLALRGGLFLGVHAHLEPSLVLVLELYHAVDQRVDREVGAEADVASRVPLRAALAHDDVPRDDALAAELLDPAVLRIAVAPVAGRAYALFMCHMIARSAEFDVVDADFGEALPVSR